MQLPKKNMEWFIKNPTPSNNTNAQYGFFMPRGT